MGNELTIQSMATLADAFYASGLFPDIKSQAQAIVKIQAGAELGFAPIYSMQKVYIVQGKIVIAAEAMGALVKKSGTYSYGVKDYTDEIVSLQFTKHGKDEFLSAFTMSDARKAGLIKPGSGWEKFPRAMLTSKALSQGARIVCPEVIAGVYTFEDFELQTNDEGELAETPKVIINPIPAQEKRPAETVLTPSEPRQDTPQGTQPAKQVETVTPEPNERMNLLRADMVKINLKETAAVGYLANKLKVPGIVAGDNFDTAFGKATILQQGQFRNYVTGQMKLI